MKTGFVKAFVNIPGNKAYKYHGLNRSCDIQPDPDPFKEYPEAPTGPVWNLLYDFDFYVGYPEAFKYTEGDILNSTENDHCIKKWPGGFARYYFCECIMYATDPPQWLGIWWSDGIQCKISYYEVLQPFIYKAWYNVLWADSYMYCMVSRGGVGSHMKFWGSSTGELPGYWPVPPT